MWEEFKIALNPLLDYMTLDTRYSNSVADFFEPFFTMKPVPGIGCMKTGILQT